MKAIALISGGLDSLVAARLVWEQGIEIIPLYFKIPFCQRNKNDTFTAEDILARRVADLGWELKSADISSAFLDLIVNPRHGFGANMNPCIDCKILMLSKAKEMMSQFGAMFVITGEVLGQRPMSQHRQALELIEEKSGLEGLLLRPLSAKLLTETTPEKEGWVSRDKLLDYSGRTRRPQIQLAAALNIKDYPNAAGGCLLTDPEFSKRLKDLVLYRTLDMHNLELLKFGRHFRLSAGAKLVVGRDEREDNIIFSMAGENDYLFIPADDLAGPTSLGIGTFDAGLLELSCSITCRYCDLNGKESATILYKKIPVPQNQSFTATALDHNRIIALRI